MLRAGCIPAAAVVLLAGREPAVRRSECFAGRAVVPVGALAGGEGRAVVPVGALAGGEGRAVVPVGVMTGIHDSGPASGRGGTTSRGRNCDRGRSWCARLPFGRTRQLGGVPVGEVTASGPPLYKVPRTGGCATGTNVRGTPVASFLVEARPGAILVIRFAGSSR